MGENIIGDSLRTIFITSVVVCLFMAVYITIAFFLFTKWRINFDLTPTLAVMALTTTAADIIHITAKHLVKEPTYYI